MSKWWLLGRGEKAKLEDRRREAISDITGERLSVELIAQRPRRATDTLDNALLANVLERLKDIEESAKRATNTDELEDLTDDAELQGLFSGYICPVTEMHDEGKLANDLIEWWGVPKTETTKLHNLFDEKLALSENSTEAHF